MAYLKGVDDPTSVVEVDDSVMFGVALFEFFTQSFKPFFLQPFLEKLPGGFGDGRNVIDSFTDGINIHHASARKDGNMLALV